MNEFTFKDYVDISQIVIAVTAVFGTMISIFFSMKSLQEVRIDRRLRAKPHLAFECRGNLLNIEFVKAGKRIPGVNPKYVERKFFNLPDDAESVRIITSLNKVDFGKLKNYGLGPALETEIVWQPERVKIGSEEFVIDKRKLSEAVYSTELNTIPAWDSHILPGSDTGVTRLPTFIEKDFEKKISEVQGILEISCKDVYGKKHVTTQRFFISTKYKNAPPCVLVTFGDLIN